jgi:hypothetical protein
MASKHWTQNEDVKAYDYWKDGLSATETGLRMGKTRGSIIGRWSRLGLTKASKPATAKQPKPKPKRVRRRPQPISPIQKFLRGPPTQPDTPKSALLSTYAPEPLRIPFMSIREGQCRDICGHDGLALFCGHPTIEGTSYCGFHCRMNFQHRGVSIARV